MSAYDEVLASEWLRDGVAAAKAGRRDEARELLMRVVEVHESSEQAWLWLSGVVDADEDRLVCLENVLTLNPDNARARAGIKWLEERKRRLDIGDASPRSEADGDWSAGRGAQGRADGEESGAVSAPAPWPVDGEDADAFMSPDGCVYCGLDVRDEPLHCPHCGGRLLTRQFKREERSGMSYQLYAFWIMLCGINLAEVFFIRFNWKGLADFVADKAPSSLAPHVLDLLYDVFSLVVRPEATGATGTEALVVEFVLFGLVILGGLVALGLFFRRPWAHVLGLGLIALQFLAEGVLFLRAFPGFFLAGVQALYTILLMLFMSQTVEDFSQEVRREWLEVDRHAVNAMDFYSRGRIYEKRGMWAKALLHWQRAAVLNPTQGVYFAALARAYAHLGRYDAALGQVDKALQVSHTPDEWRPLREIIVEARERGEDKARSAS